MDEFLEYLKIAEGMGKEAEEIRNVQDRLDDLNREITELLNKEKEIKAVPDKVETYQKRLGKLQEEIEKQNAIKRKIESPEEISKLRNFINQKELAAKVLEYFSTLYSEQSTVISVEGMKVKVNRLKISLKYNELLQQVQAYLPGHFNAHIQTITKLVVDAVLLSSNVLSIVHKESVEIITYAASKRTEIAQSEIHKQILEDLDIQDAESYIANEKLHGTLSKLAIFEDILIEVKTRLLRDLHQLSCKQVDRYNNELFYGTVYHIENTDTWYCDNLVQKIGEVSKKAEARAEEITDAQKKGLANRLQMSTSQKAMSILDILSESMQRQKVASISHAFFKSMQILERIATTERSHKEKIQKAIIEKIQEHFELPSGLSEHVEMQRCALRLADSQAVLGIISLAPLHLAKTEKEEINNGIVQIFGQKEEYFVDIVDESFSHLILCTKVDRIDFLSTNVTRTISMVNNIFIEIIDRIFTDSLLFHIKNNVLQPNFKRRLLHNTI
ncbi:hypothetical protein NERG_00195 [Nematocida ausubeli]|uniref:Uncharacterized protein n=1 Tax=Nematocida ausubeli (strain ATCC PRA-371 / ERTm2) TaxID=1913371 RepID=H8Z9C4_NEMA1|nr:hypothetical protein NERG_00195 [Nematocida ausubeli]